MTFSRGRSSGSRPSGSERPELSERSERQERPARAQRPARPRPPRPGREDDQNGESPVQQEPKRPAKLYAAWLLGQREWSAKELRTRLRLKGYSDAAIEECMAFLAKHQLQDDARFAEARARSKSRQLGNRRIQQDLMSKGIAEEDAQAAMAELGDEQERARAAARRFDGKPFTQELKAKAWRFLASRGFGSDAIEEVLRDLERGAREV